MLMLHVHLVLAVGLVHIIVIAGPRLLGKLLSGTLLFAVAGENNDILVSKASIRGDTPLLPYSTGANYTSEAGDFPLDLKMTECEVWSCCSHSVSIRITCLKMQLTWKKK